MTTMEFSETSATKPLPSTASPKGISVSEGELITYHIPSSEHGFLVNRLVAKSPPLDPNSVYCNLLQCSHFAETSVSAILDKELVGFVSGYRIPTRPDTLFVWQVVVSRNARGKGLASRMLNEILARPACGGVRFLETTITPSNEASWGLFKKFAEKKGAELEVSLAFDKDRHFHGRHETEQLLRIGPFAPEKEIGDST